jgi:hypothetical protein
MEMPLKDTPVVLPVATTRGLFDSVGLKASISHW